jgi:zinc transport system ATP-binding protein
MTENVAALEKTDSSSEPLLEAREICKFYAGREVLHEVSLAIRPREIVTIVGPNGAGKTTLLSCLIGLTKPDRGDVFPADNLRIGYVPQHFRPQPSMPLTVRSFLKLYGLRDTDRTTQLADLLDVTPIMDSQTSVLSGGELRRVLLLRALLRNPQLLVLDEPTQGVDVAGQGEFYRLLKKLADTQNLAVLMVSHDLHVVMASTQRVICLNRHICCEGAPERVGSDPQFKALFGEDLAKQLAMYHHHHTHTHALHEPREEHHHHEGCNHG